MTRLDNVGRSYSVVTEIVRFRESFIFVSKCIGRVIQYESYSMTHESFSNFVKMVGFGPHVCDYQKFCLIINIIDKIF